MAATLTLGLLGGCLQSQPLPSLPQGAPETFPSDRYANTGSGQVLAIADSMLTVLVYRGGRLRHLGHNHVLTSSKLGGLVFQARDNDLSDSYADLYLPLASLVVDDPAARKLAGEAFSSEPSDADRRGTLSNLLGPKVLDAERFPHLSASVQLEPGPNDDYQAKIELRLRGEDIALSTPVTITPKDAGWTLETRFELTHAQLGLTPFSVLGGAIAVADPIHVHLTLRAAR